MSFINYGSSHRSHVLGKRKLCAKTQCWLYNIKRMTHVDMCSYPLVSIPKEKKIYSIEGKSADRGNFRDELPTYTFFWASDIAQFWEATSQLETSRRVRVVVHCRV